MDVKILNKFYSLIQYSCRFEGEDDPDNINQYNYNVVFTRDFLELLYEILLCAFNNNLIERIEKNYMLIHIQNSEACDVEYEIDWDSAGGLFPEVVCLFVTIDAYGTYRVSSHLTTDDLRKFISEKNKELALYLELRMN